LVKPNLVVEVTYLSWTEGNVPRQVWKQGEREDNSRATWFAPYRTLEQFTNLAEKT
jgi:hypothetical protein